MTSTILWVALLTYAIPWEIIQAQEYLLASGYREPEAIEADFTVAQAFPTSVTVQWQDNLTAPFVCLISIKIDLSSDQTSCIEAYEERQGAPEKIPFEERSSTSVNQFLLSNFEQRRNELANSKYLHSETVKLAWKYLTAQEEVSGVSQVRSLTSAATDGKFVRRYNIEGLETCQYYQLRLITGPDESDLNSSFSYCYVGDSLQVTTIVDDSIPPASLTCEVAEDNLSLTLSWVQPVEVCEVDYYIVTYTATSLWSDDSVNDDSSVVDLTFSLNPVLVYAEYEFNVIAIYQNYNISSAPANITCRTLEAESSPPQNVTVLDYQSSSITIGWEPPSAANGIIQSYQISYIKSSSTGNASSIMADTTLATVTDLDQCAEYEFTVRAVNGLCLGEASEAISGSTVSEDDPHLDVICASDVSNITVSWNAIYLNCTETQYSVEYNYSVLWKTESKNSDPFSVNHDHSFVVPEEDVIPATYYRITVTTEESVVGACSFRTDDAKSNAPAITETYSTPTSIYVEWSTPTEANGVITSYNVSYLEEECESCMLQFSTVNETFINITEIQSCALFRVQVSAVNGAGSGDAADDEIATGYSGPTSFLCNAESSSEILVEWESSGKCASTGYDLGWQGTSLWETDVDFNGTAPVNESFSTCRLSELHPYTFYTICLHSDLGEEDVCCNCTTLEGKSSPPGILLSNATSASIYVSWSPPLEAQGIIISYKITYFDVDFDTSFSVEVDSSIHGVNETESVAPCTQYVVEVAAINGYGDGEPDSVSVETLLEGLPNISCEAESPSEVMVLWDAPLSCPASGYSVTWQGESLWENDVFFNGSSSVNGSADDFLMKDLHPYTAYEICVQRQASRSCCDVTTDEAAPTEPQNMAITDVTWNSMRLEWQEPERWNGRELGYSLTCAGEMLNTTNTSMTLNDLESGTKYTISVVACSGGGCSPPVNDEDTTDGDTTHVSDDKTVLIVSLSVVSAIIVVALVIASFMVIRKTSRTFGDVSGTLDSNDEFQFESLDEFKGRPTQTTWAQEDITATWRL